MLLLDLSKLKELAEDKINLTEKLNIVLGREENIAGTRENPGYQHFLVFLPCFQKASFPGPLNLFLEKDVQ